ncbi:hypothetical protein ATCC90586_001102 [Pythium insidiosum]|nr:hypothetical protein ATCC90586_001102 [Pythium insidiosum]
MAFASVAFWTLLALVVAVTQAYTLISRTMQLVAHTYFRKISVYGINNLPREGPVILCPNHPNMFVDAILVITECVKHGRKPYAWVKGAMFSNKILGFILRKLGANKRMFENTWDVLAKGNMMLLFPEGTSYTAPKMLRLRTGVVRVATGFAKHHDQPVSIVPVGLTYFNKDSFRSEVMVEFGTPMVIGPDDVLSETFKSDEKAEVKRLTEQLEEKMHHVTLNASDFATIRVARVMRRLFLNTAANIDANKDIRLTQEIINMIERDTNDEATKERIQATFEKVKRYKDALDSLRIKDQDIVQPLEQKSLLHLFMERALYLLVLLPLGTPGLLLNFPFYFLGQKLNELAGFTESKSMFKIVAAWILVPVQWLFLIGVGWLVGGASYAYVLAVGLPLLLYSHIRVLEESRTVLENVNFLFNIAAHKEQVDAIRKEREGLVKEVEELVTFGVDAKFLSTIRKAVIASAANSPMPSMRAIVTVTRLCLIAATTVSLATAALMSSMSFSKPFDSISAEGERQVGASWDFGGSTVVNRHFARLTPDRQSRRGYIWSKEKIGRREFSAVFTFRISGQAESWFGDGLAIWFTTTPSYVMGDNHGFTGSFRGFGFVFDTFVNQEHPGGHRDVMLVENNGTRTLDDLNYLPKLGCMAPGIRYHEKNAAFSPSLNMSRAKIQYKHRYVTVSIDAKNTGEWVTCYAADVSIPEEWVEQSTIGITASTGGLADNHDVISLKVYDDVIDEEHNLVDEKVKSRSSTNVDSALAEGADADTKIKFLKRKYEQMIEDFEHEFTALKESTENTIKKLREQEAEDTKHIQELETWVNNKVADSAHRSYYEVKDEVDKKLKKTVEDTAQKTASWKTPFFLLVLVLSGVVAAAYKKYQDLRKSHLL